MTTKRADLTANPPALEPLLSTDGIAQLLCVSRRTIERMRAAGKLPKPDLWVGSLPRWKPETIRAWIESQTQSN